MLDAWAYEHHVRLSFIQSGKLVENAYIESFNGRCRDECLNAHWFLTITHARQLIENWRIEYSTERSHNSLGDLSPEQFARAPALLPPSGRESALRAEMLAKTGEMIKT